MHFFQNMISDLSFNAYSFGRTVNSDTVFQEKEITDVQKLDPVLALIVIDGLTFWKSLLSYKVTSNFREFGENIS